MAHMSPAVNLVWAFLSTMLAGFLIFHLWSFDRFKCLKWSQGPHSGTFKRIMTYSYLLSIPLLMIYAVGFAIIKYNYGYTIIPGHGIIPTPYQMWDQTSRNAIFPLFLSFSFAWAFEMVTHLEELCFWLFLVNSSSDHQDWFRSPYFITWAVGSCISVLAMPLITIFTREDVYKCEAYTFLTGGLGGLSLTIWFLPVLWTFPSFLAGLKEQGIETGTLVRLTKFHELNCIRVVFRFLFTIPFVILGIDGVRPHHTLNEQMFPTDFLSIMAGIGCVVSSGLTLVIFFPRSVEGEIAMKERQRSRRKQRAQRNSAGMSQSGDDLPYISITHSKTDVDQCESVSFGTLPNASLSFPGLPAYEVVIPRGHDRMSSMKEKLEGMNQLGGSISLQPNRRTKAGDVELGTVLTVGEVELIRKQSTRDRGVSSLVQHWRSPIEIGRPTASRWQQQA